MCCVFRGFGIPLEEVCCVFAVSWFRVLLQAKVKVGFFDTWRHVFCQEFSTRVRMCPNVFCAPFEYERSGLIWRENKRIAEFFYG